MAVAGVIAGCVEAIVTQPFEVVKTRQQIEAKVSPSMTRCMINTIKSNGVQGLYAGLPIMVLQSGGKVGIRFGMYGYVNSYFPDSALIAGVAAGCTEAALWITPCERIKVLIIKHRERKNRFSLVLRSLHSEGITSLYRGTSPTVIRNGASVGFRFMLYEKLMPIIGNAALTGAIVGAISTVLNNPIDVIKSSMQAGDKSTTGHKSKRGLLYTVNTIIQTQGYKYLFTAGLKARILKITIGQAVIFQTIATVKTYYP